VYILINLTKTEIMILTVIFGVVFVGVAVFIFKKRNDAKKEAAALTLRKKSGSKVIKKQPKPYVVPKGKGYDKQGNPVKMPNEIGADFKAREAHHYYVNGRG
jgi:hypothetical protein